MQHQYSVKIRAWGCTLVETEAMDGGSGGGQRQCTNVGVSYVLARFYSFNFRFSDYFVSISHQYRQMVDGEDTHVEGCDSPWRPSVISACIGEKLKQNNQ